MTEMVMPAAKPVQSMECSPWKDNIPTANRQVLEPRLAERERQRDVELVPAVQKLEDEDHRDHRAREWQDQPEGIREGRAVHPGSVKQFPRQTPKEPREQQDIECARTA